MDEALAFHEAVHLVAAYDAGFHPYAATSSNWFAFSVEATVDAVRLSVRVDLAGRAGEDICLGRKRTPAATRMHTCNEYPDTDLMRAVDVAFRFKTTVAEVERFLDAEDKVVCVWLAEQRAHLEHFSVRLLAEGSIEVRFHEGRKIPRWPRPRWTPIWFRAAPDTESREVPTGDVVRRGTKDRPRFYMRYVDVDGRRHQRIANGAQTDAEARPLTASAELRVAEGRVGVGKVKPPAPEGLSRTTIMVADLADRFLGDVEHFRDGLTLTPASVANEFATLSKVHEWPCDASRSYAWTRVAASSIPAASPNSTTSAIRRSDASSLRPTPMSPNQTRVSMPASYLSRTHSRCSPGSAAWRPGSPGTDEPPCRARAR